MNQITYLCINRNEPGFYDFMGPLFGSRSVAKEVGINMYDDENKKWFVAFDDDKFIGCASIRGSVVSDCYVMPLFRHCGIFSAILKNLVCETSGTLRAACTSASVEAFKNLGFRVIGSTKNYTYVELKRA